MVKEEGGRPGRNSLDNTLRVLVVSLSESEPVCVRLYY